MSVLAVVLVGGCSMLSTTSAAAPSSTTAPRTPATAATTTTVAPVPTTTAKPGLSKPKVPKSGAYFGTWRGPGPGRPKDPMLSIAQAEQQIGRKYAIDHQYYDWDAAIPSAYDRWTAAQGRIPMVSLCTCHFSDGSAVKWARIAAGKEDVYLTSIAKGFAAFKKPAFFVFESEPETQVPTDGTAADYVAAFRHVVAVFRANGANNVAFVWATTTYAFQPASGETALVESMYPGDDVVDWISSDPYNFDTAGAWQSLSYELGPWYSWATANHPKKPLALTEWGSKEDKSQPNRKAAWFKAALSQLESTYENVRAVVYFDEKKFEHGTVNDWRIDTSPASLAAFAQISKAGWFAATA